MDVINMEGKNGGIFCLLLKQIIHLIFMFTAGYFQNHSIQFNVNLKDSRSSKTMQHTNQSKKKKWCHLSNKGYVYSNSPFYITQLCTFQCISSIHSFNA